MDNTRPLKSLQRVIDLCGTQAELANRVATFKKNPKIKQAHVWNWLNRDGGVPPDCVIAVEWASIERGEDGEVVAQARPRVTRHDLAPELYPEEVRVSKTAGAR